MLASAAFWPFKRGAARGGYTVPTRVAIGGFTSAGLKFSGCDESLFRATMLSKCQPALHFGLSRGGAERGVYVVPIRVAIGGFTSAGLKFSGRDESLFIATMLSKC